MADWNKPTLTTAYVDFLNELKARDEDAAKMDYGSNVPTGAIRWNTSTHMFERWSGSAWSALTGICWANRRTTDQYVWIQRKDNVPLRATRQGTEGDIIRFYWTPNEGEDGDVKLSINAQAERSTLYVHHPTNSSKKIYLSAVNNSGTPLFKLNAYDYDAGTPMNFVLGYSMGQIISTPSKIHIENTIDVKPDTDVAPLTIGKVTEQNIGIDNNEIMARNNGAASKLSLNREGGSAAFFETSASILYVNGTTQTGRVKTDTITSKSGQQLVLNAGEAEGKFSGQTNEYVYINAEQGLIVTTPDDDHGNFEDGYESRPINLHGRNDGVVLGRSPSAGTASVVVGSFVDAGDNSVVLGCCAGSTAANTSIMLGAHAGENGAYEGCVFIGNSAGEGQSQSNTSGQNIGVGYNAMHNIDGGWYNTSVGGYSAYYLIDGNNNVNFGYYAGYSISNGDNNTNVGHEAGRNMSSGNSNTCVGFRAGSDITTGSNNIALGNYAGKSNSPFDISTHSNRIVLGNNDITNAYIKVAWTVTSDKRDKRDIDDITYGLDYIRGLRPRKFRFDDRSRYWETKTDARGETYIDKSQLPDGTKADEEFMWGFISQEVAEVETKLGIENSPVVDRHNPEKLGLKETALIPVLVNAVKELSDKVEALEARIEQLKKESSK